MCGNSVKQLLKPLALGIDPITAKVQAKIIEPLTTKVLTKVGLPVLRDPLAELGGGSKYLPDPAGVKAEKSRIARQGASQGTPSSGLVIGQRYSG